MKIAYKINAFVLVVLVAGVLAGAFFFQASLANIRSELYKWFDESASNLAASLGDKTREHLTSLDYQALNGMLEQRLREDPNFLYGTVSYGKNLSESAAAGDPDKKPYRVYNHEVRDENLTLARISLHYGTETIERKLSSLLWSIGLSLVATFILLLVCLHVLVSVLVNRPLNSFISHARNVAAGNLTASVDMDRRDEFGQLAADFNRMTESLRVMAGRVSAAFADLDRITSSVAEAARGINEGSGKQADSVNEVSSSAKELNATVKKAATVVDSLSAIAQGSSSATLEISTTVDQVAGSADSLLVSVEQTSSSIAQMSVSIQHVAQNVDTLSALLSEASSALTEMDFSVKEVESNAGEANKLSEQVTRMVGEEGQKAVTEAIAVIDKIKNSVTEAARVIMVLGGKSQDIGEIINVINDVNSQTNLLALNAAIIAAQAGEQGRGFAVVADEIRELSGRTTASTKEITALITGVQTEVKNAVRAMEEGSRSVEEGVNVIGEVNATLHRMAENTVKASAASREIAKATSEQSKGIKMISKSAQNMFQMSKEIAKATREQTQGSSFIINAAENMKSQAAQVRQATTEQAKGIRQVSKASEESAVMAGGIVKITRDEARSSELIVSCVERIKEITAGNATAVSRLEGAVRAFADQAALLKREIERFKVES